MNNETKFVDKPINLNVPEGTTDINIAYEEKATRRLVQWNPRDYTFNSVQSFADFVVAKCEEGKAVIVYNDGYIKAVMDETVQDRPLEYATYKYKKSLAFIEWSKALGTRLTQKEFVKFLKSREPNENVENLIMQFSKLNLVTSIIGEYHQDDNGNLTFAYKETTGQEGVASIPNRIIIDIPLLNESEFTQEMEIEIELIRPKSEDDKPMIILTCPRAELYIKRAVENEVEKLKEELIGYLVLAGDL